MAQQLRVSIAFIAINPVSNKGLSKTNVWDDRTIGSVDVQLSSVLTAAAAIVG
jgi:hypothetical protein